MTDELYYRTSVDGYNVKSVDRSELRSLAKVPYRYLAVVGSDELFEHDRGFLLIKERRAADTIAQHRANARRRAPVGIWKNAEQAAGWARSQGFDELADRISQREIAKAAYAVRQPEDEGKTGNEEATPHEQLMKWAEVTLGNSKERTLLELIVARDVTNKSKLRDALGYPESENRAFNTLLSTVNRKLKQGKKSRKIEAFYWLDGRPRQGVKLLTGDEAKARHF